MRTRKEFHYKDVVGESAAAIFPFLKVVTDFAKKIVRELGEVKSVVGSETLYFGAFSFHASQTETGRNEIKIWYHPNGEYKEGMKPVLDVFWDGDTKYELPIFSHREDWQYGILDLIGKDQKSNKTERVLPHFML